MTGVDGAGDEACARRVGLETDLSGAVLATNVGDAGGDARSMGLASVPRLPAAWLEGAVTDVDIDDDDDGDVTFAGGTEVDAS